MAAIETAGLTGDWRDRLQAGVRVGDRIMVVGDVGMGKTTLVKAIAERSGGVALMLSGLGHSTTAQTRKALMAFCGRSSKAGATPVVVFDDIGNAKHAVQIVLRGAMERFNGRVAFVASACTIDDVDPVVKCTMEVVPLLLPSHENLRIHCRHELRKLGVVPDDRDVVAVLEATGGGFSGVRAGAARHVACGAACEAHRSPAMAGLAVEEVERLRTRPGENPIPSLAAIVGNMRDNGVVPADIIDALPTSDPRVVRHVVTAKTNLRCGAEYLVLLDLLCNLTRPQLPPDRL